MRTPRATRIPLVAWVGDGLDARRSAKAGIPAVGDLPPAPTGRQSEIARHADHVTAKIRRDTETRTARLEAHLAGLHEQIACLDARIAATSAEINDILARPALRLPAETSLPEAMVITRRANDNQRDAASIRDQISPTVEQRERLAIEAARVAHEIEMVWRAARSQARAVNDVARRREARYWRLLCATHPDGVRLAGLFDHPRILTPDWVDQSSDTTEKSIR